MASWVTEGRKHLLINLLLALALYFAFVCSFFKAKYNDLAMLKIAKTFETLPSAQFAIHDVSTWAIKCAEPFSLALALIICLFYPHDIQLRSAFILCVLAKQALWANWVGI
jgi:hypothetical protein